MTWRHSRRRARPRGHDAGARTVQGGGSRLLALLTLPLFAVGVFACFVWYKLIYRYRHLIGWRYDQLMAMEKTLPDSYQMYSKEKEEFFTLQRG